MLFLHVPHLDFPQILWMCETVDLLVTCLFPTPSGYHLPSNMRSPFLPNSPEKLPWLVLHALSSTPELYTNESLLSGVTEDTLSCRVGEGRRGVKEVRIFFFLPTRTRNLVSHREQALLCGCICIYFFFNRF